LNQAERKAATWKPLGPGYPIEDTRPPEHRAITGEKISNIVNELAEAGPSDIESGLK
jgi:hypothetical protein